MVNERQFTILSEMGIDLWQRKSQVNVAEKTQSADISQPVTNDESINESVSSQSQESKSEAPKKQASKSITAPLDTNQLLSIQIFEDVLNALSLTAGDISIEHNEQGEHLNLGLLNWQFSEEANSISFDKNKLLTPPLQLFHRRNDLKKNLWKIMLENQLC